MFSRTNTELDSYTKRHCNRIVPVIERITNEIAYTHLQDSDDRHLILQNKEDIHIFHNKNDKLSSESVAINLIFQSGSTTTCESSNRSTGNSVERKTLANIRRHDNHEMEYITQQLNMQSVKR